MSKKSGDVKLIYMMHPVKGGRYWRIPEYIAAANRLLRPHGLALVAPYFAQVVNLSSDADPKARQFWLGVDKQHVCMYWGAAAFGPEMTPGMEDEWHTAKIQDKPRWNLTGLEPDRAAWILFIRLQMEGYIK